MFLYVIYVGISYVDNGNHNPPKISDEQEEEERVFRNSREMKKKNIKK